MLRAALTLGEPIHARPGVAPLQLGIEHAALLRLRDGDQGKEKKNRGQSPISVIASAKRNRALTPIFLSTHSGFTGRPRGCAPIRLQACIDQGNYFVDGVGAHALLR